MKKIFNEKDYLIDIFDNNVYIKNYVLIKEISYNKIRIILVNNIIDLRGNNLIIAKLDEKELLIKGELKGIDFIE